MVIFPIDIHSGWMMFIIDTGSSDGNMGAINAPNHSRHVIFLIKTKKVYILKLSIYNKCYTFLNNLISIKTIYIEDRSF